MNSMDLIDNMTNVDGFLKELKEFETQVSLRYDYLLTSMDNLDNPIDDEKATIIAENKYLTKIGFDVENFEKLRSDLSREYYYYRLKYEIAPSRLDNYVNPEKIQAYEALVKEIDNMKTREANQEKVSEDEKETFWERYNDYKVNYEFKPTLSERLMNPDKVRDYELLREGSLQPQGLGPKDIQSFVLHDFDNNNEPQKKWQNKIKSYENKYYRAKDPRPSKLGRYINPKQFSEYQHLKELSALIKKLNSQRTDLLKDGKQTIANYKKAIKANDVPTKQMKEIMEELGATRETLNTISQARQCCKDLGPDQKIDYSGSLTSQSLNAYIDELNKLREESGFKPITATVTVKDLDAALEKHLQDLSEQIKSIGKKLQNSRRADDFPNIRNSMGPFETIKAQYRTFSELKDKLGRISNKEQKLICKGDLGDPSVIWRQASTIDEQSFRILTAQEFNKGKSRDNDKGKDF